MVLLAGRAGAGCRGGGRGQRRRRRLRDRVHRPAGADAAAFLSTRKRGAAVMAGIPRADAQLLVPARSIPRMERRVLGSIYGSSRPDRDFPLILDAYRRGRLPLDRLISHRLSLDEVEQRHRRRPLRRGHPGRARPGRGMTGPAATRRMPVRRRALRGARPAPPRADLPLRRVPALARHRRPQHRRRPRPAGVRGGPRPALDRQPRPAMPTPAAAFAASAAPACSGTHPAGRRWRSRPAASTATPAFASPATGSPARRATGTSCPTTACPGIQRSAAVGGRPSPSGRRGRERRLVRAQPRLSPRL